MSSIEEFLESMGFKRDEDIKAMFIKRSSDAVTHCECDEIPPLIRAIVDREVTYPNGHRIPSYVAIEILGEFNDLWHTGRIYTTSEEFMKRSEEVIEAVTTTWEAFTSRVR